MAPQKRHIAVLDVDVPIPKVYAARGLYSTQFRTLLRAAASRLNQSSLQETPVEIHTTAFDAVGGCLPPFECLRTSSEAGHGPLGPIDGILVTGSASSAYETATKPWIADVQRFIQKVYVEYPEVKMFGSCFGHQIIAQALLGASDHSINGEKTEGMVKVEHSPTGYEVGIHPIALTPEIKSSIPILATLPSGQFRLQLIHGDRVISVSDNTGLPPGWVNLGSTAKCPIQGLYHPSRVLTYQGHFEFDVFVNRETCVEFGSRWNWAVEDVQRSVAQIEVAAVEGRQDEDDSRLAAEVVILFFVG